MKYASAMKYGGELVDAVDCDYDSFKELIPLCPNCKEPVFLRTGGPRESVKGKAYQIGPHWCHFKGISAEQVAGCELRVNGYTEKDRAKIAAQARGQRLKLLQRWFWTVYMRNQYQLNPLWAKDVSQQEFIKTMTDLVVEEKQVWKENPKVLERFLNECRTVMQTLVKSVDFKTLRTEFRNSALQDVAGLPKELRPESLERAEVLFNIEGVESELNNKIAMQVIEFICADRQQSLLTDVVTFHTLIISAAKNEKDVHRLMAMDVKSKAAMFVLMIAHAIGFTPWASEFQRLEAEARQRKGAA